MESSYFYKDCNFEQLLNAFSEKYNEMLKKKAEQKRVRDEKKKKEENELHPSLVNLYGVNL